MKLTKYFILIAFTSFFLISCVQRTDIKEIEKITFSVSERLSRSSWVIIQRELKDRIIDKPHRILIIGDSMADGFGFFMLKNFRNLKHTLIRAGVTSSSSMFWANSDSLSYLINLHSPDYVMIFLGSNEYKYKDTVNLVRVVQKIVGDTQGIPYIWVGPELDTKDGRYNRILKSVLGQGRYASLKEFSFKHGKVKNHPSEDGWIKLAGQLNEWIMFRSDYPLKLLN